MPHADRVRTPDDRTHAAVISGSIESDDGMTPEPMRGPAPENAAALSGTGIEDIPVMDVFGSSIGDPPGETIAWRHQGHHAGHGEHP